VGVGMAEEVMGEEKATAATAAAKEVEVRVD
jgi:hypothetical protein